SKTLIEPPVDPTERRPAVTLSLQRVIARFSVRTRIILLAMIPVVGFMATGIAFVVSEQKVESAFKAAERASDLADLGRDFRNALVTMRVQTHDFTARPNRDLVHDFERTHA